MNTLKICFSIATVLTLSGCYSAGGWTPTVDTYNDRNVDSIDRDMSDCEQLANQASGGTASEITTGAVVGGLVGGAAGAAMGAAAGGFGGATQEGLSSEQAYKRAYSNCMIGRGHRVIN